MQISINSQTARSAARDLTESGPYSPPHRQWPVWTIRAALLAWAGFWSWFVLAVGFGEDVSKSWPYMLLFLVPIVTLTSATLRWPRTGGALLLAGGIISAYFFWRVPSTIVLFCGPPILLGAAAVWWGCRR